MKKLLIILLLISGILVMGASCSDNYNTEVKPPQNQEIGGGCGVAPMQSDNTLPQSDILFYAL
ncbi:MAG: hypothetical protein AABY22_11825 [Nanoarchaeota archaeon]